MNKGFSLIECVIYLLCITITFGLLSEMVFKFYLRVDADLKALQGATNSFICLHNIVHDFRQAMSTEGIKLIEHDSVTLKQIAAEVQWALKGKRLYRLLKKFNIEGKPPNKTMSLMMNNVNEFSFIKYFNNNETMNTFGFEVVLQNDWGKFEHHVAIRGNNP